MPRKLHKLRIDEVSAVDKGAGEGTRIAFWKRDPAAVYRKIFGAETLRDVLDRDARNLALPRFAKQDDLDLDEDDIHDLVDSIDGRDGGNGGGDGSAGGSSTSRHISHLADMIAESAGVERQTALSWLLNHRNGLALLNRTLGKRLQKETPPMNDTLSAVAKQYGIAAVCKHIIERGSSNIGEHDFVKVVTDSIERRDGETREAAFSRVFCSDDGLAIRKAVQVLKRRAEPAVAGAAPGAAYAAIEAKAAELRKADPKLTKEMAFAKAFTAPENIELARAECAANRPA